MRISVGLDSAGVRGLVRKPQDRRPSSAGTGRRRRSSSERGTCDYDGDPGMELQPVGRWGAGEKRAGHFSHLVDKGTWVVDY
jgi:hypothetical protein